MAGRTQKIFGGAVIKDRNENNKLEMENCVCGWCTATAYAVLCCEGSFFFYAASVTVYLTTGISEIIGNDQRGVGVVLVGCGCLL